jgi:hypothetical protein
LAVVGAYSYFSSRDSSAGPAIVDLSGPYSPIAVENPSLRFDLLENVHKAEYKGTHRNIFSATLPPVPPTAQQIAQMNAAANAQNVLTSPPPPPPVVVDLKFYGYVEDPHKNVRRAFFTNGEDIFIAGVGDTLEKRLRVVRIGNDSVELEEISTSRRATVNIVPEDRAS